MPAYLKNLGNQLSEIAFLVVTWKQNVNSHFCEDQDLLFLKNSYKLCELQISDFCSWACVRGSIHTTVSHIYANLGFDVFRIAARPNKAHKLKWIEIDPNSNIIRINEHEKKSNPRLIKISPKLIAMLNMLPKNQRISSGR